jgi:hypothetical protein
MKTLAALATLASMSLFADPGIMIDIDIFIPETGPSGKGGNQVEMACK